MHTHVIKTPDYSYHAGTCTLCILLQVLMVTGNTLENTAALVLSVRLLTNITDNR